MKAEYAAQSAAFVPPSGGISCAATQGGRIEEKPPAALSYAHRADFIHGLARVISLLATAKHACGDAFLPIMCKRLANPSLVRLAAMFLKSGSGIWFIA